MRHGVHTGRAAFDGAGIFLVIWLGINFEFPKVACEPAFFAAGIKNNEAI